MIVYPNAKINIGLMITGKRVDGFHDIETAFYPVSLCDVLEIKLANSEKKISLECMGIDLGDQPVENNLCYKAYCLLDTIYDLPPVTIRLHKRIPIGAGLGGGSSDAAYTLKTLNQLFLLGISDSELVEYAGRLGSDCSFFIGNRPAIGKGKGDVLTPVPLSLTNYHILLVKPPVFVSTAEAYSEITPAEPEVSLSELLKLPLEKWKTAINNDFENSVFGRHPEIGKIKEQLYNLGAIYASMSGSGSSVYGIFREIPKDIKEIFSGCFVWCD
ncbi:MAG: 4-(cytidine 5'-diphospho)-2-C-methyl-D-erythritol kinase [Bacteroidales bacterium]|jgi:4-diphosphocytidyl-2-C-methyl-D-erythritol kinase|nr:4-(cytidine 5'-diphospho)-2-C-methyl-D-erythritol kinase [Bacteroidales bacterium]